MDVLRLQMQISRAVYPELYELLAPLNKNERTELLRRYANQYLTLLNASAQKEALVALQVVAAPGFSAPSVAAPVAPANPTVSVAVKPQSKDLEAVPSAGRSAQEVAATSSGEAETAVRRANGGSGLAQRMSSDLLRG